MNEQIPLFDLTALDYANFGLWLLGELYCLADDYSEAESVFSRAHDLQYQKVLDLEALA